MLPEFGTLQLPSIDSLVKILVYLVLACFVVYALFLWRQVVLAARVLDTKATPLVRFLALVHFMAVIVVGFVVVFIIL